MNRTGLHRILAVPKDAAKRMATVQLLLILGRSTKRPEPVPAVVGRVVRVIQRIALALTKTYEPYGIVQIIDFLTQSTDSRIGSHSKATKRGRVFYFRFQGTRLRCQHRFGVGGGIHATDKTGITECHFPKGRSVDCWRIGALLSLQSDPLSESLLLRFMSELQHHRRFLTIYWNNTTHYSPGE